MRDEVQEEENVWKVISIVEPMWLQPVKEIVANSDFFSSSCNKKLNQESSLLNTIITRREYGFTKDIFC